ncbi:AAA family ATPase, partial [Streptomyces sp. 8N706]
YRLARRTCGFAARNFLANGISCILDDAVFPDRPVVGLGGWKRHVGPGLLPVVLLPGLEIVLERNAQRTGNRRLSDEEVALIHGKMAGWYGSGLPIIDNSQLDVATTARVLDDVLVRTIAGQPSC